MNFISQVNDVDVYGIGTYLPKLAKLEEGKDYEIRAGEFRVAWTAEVEVRTWGIKSITPFVQSVTGSIAVEIFDETGEVGDVEIIEFDSANFLIDMIIIPNLTLNHYGTLSVDHLEIDFAKNTVEVS